MRVGKWHILGPRCHVSIASLVETILAVAMEIWNHECGPFWRNFAVFAIACHIEITISPLGTGSSQEGRANIVAYDKRLNAIEFRICSSGSYRQGFLPWTVARDGRFSHFGNHDPT